MLSGGTEGIRLEDDRITWKVPALFDNDWVALHLSHELAPLLGRPLFDIAYGSPLCAWAGGRPPRMIAPLSEDEMRRRFEAYRKVGARCAFTFSRIDAGKYVDDSYCNMLLSLIDEYGGQAIVADDGLARHIRDTHPAVSLVCSNVKVVLDHHVGFHGQDEESYYRSLLGLYDEVVVRTEALLEGGVTDRLQDLADRVELIVNERCAVDCPYAAEHIAAMTRATERAAELDPDEPQPGCIYNELHDIPRELVDNIYVSNERRAYLADRGFTRFKIQGRGASPAEFAGILFSEILHDGSTLVGSEGMRDIVTPVLLLEAFNPYSEARLSIPDKLA